jgi:hypothetical protein
VFEAVVPVGVLEPDLEQCNAGSRKIVARPSERTRGTLRLTPEPA